MKARVKTGDLGKIGIAFQQVAHGCDVVRFVKRGQRDQCIEIREKLFRYDLRRCKLGSSMDDPVPNGAQGGSVLLVRPVYHLSHQRWERHEFRKVALRGLTACRIHRDHMRGRESLVDDALGARDWRGSSLEEGEFQARRPGIERENGSFHDLAPNAWRA